METFDFVRKDKTRLYHTSVEKFRKHSKCLKKKLKKILFFKILNGRMVTAVPITNLYDNVSKEFSYAR